MKLKPLDEKELNELQAQALVAKVATTAQSGDLRMTPLWFAVDDGAILLNTFEDSAAVKNLRRNPKCSLMIDSATWPYYGVHYWGTATVEGPEDDAAGIAKMFAPYVGSLEGATDYAKTLISYGKRVYIRFKPSRKVTWDFRQ